MRELNVAEMAEVSGGCFLLGSIALGVLSSLGNWGSSWGGNSWGGSSCGYVPAPPPPPSNNCGCNTPSFSGANGGWIGGSFNDVLNSIIRNS
ncbi:hypothetical protein [Acetobacter sp.]|jgi:hypothetical protein|uniref:hypothetical protein n=1 Tax=Acetobacter sp. TaxID=440 RepID=UPI0025BFF604|nr:hypothetical protein [Acetobacter sp.]MCH4090639.1 hypothetical protein [Acetobacter sp.]MCI1300082.1 hypothetical protein [Acetobacter sp.]MCI1316500.1 hypothetical protein [Acetobacter sp.]